MSKTYNYSSPVARFYDVVYDQVRSHVDQDFFLEEMEKCKGTVLEVGVGTGRMFVEARKRGVDVYGVDVSPEMLSILNSKLSDEEAQRVWEADALDMQLDEQFDLIVAPFRVIQHMITADEQVAFLANIYRHLKPGGRFIFDCFRPNIRRLAVPMERHTEFEGEYEPGKKVWRHASTQQDGAGQFTWVTFFYEWETDAGREEHEWKFPMAYIFPRELEHLIGRSPFELEAIYGDYERNPITNDNWDMVAICRKPD